MKKQIVFDDDQLIEMVNESARRVLRGLMTEDGLDWHRNYLFSTGDEDDDEDFLEACTEAYGDGYNKGLLKRIGGKNLRKLYETDKDAFEQMVEDPMLLAVVAGTPGTADALAEDPGFMTKLTSNPNIYNSFVYAGPSQTMAFFSDENLGQIMSNTAINPQMRQYLMGVMTGTQNMDPSMLQAISQYGTQPNGGYDSDSMQQFLTGNLAYDQTTGQWYDPATGQYVNPNQLNGQPQQPQYSDDMAAMYLQQAMDVDQQISAYTAQIEQLTQQDPTNPSLPGLQANLQMLQNSKQIYQPYLQGWYRSLNDEFGNLQQSLMDPANNNPQNMQRYYELTNMLQAINSSDAYQYVASPLSQLGTPNGPQTGILGWFNNLINNARNQSGATTSGTSSGNTAQQSPTTAAATNGGQAAGAPQASATATQGGTNTQGRSNASTNQGGGRQHGQYGRNAQNSRTNNTTTNRANPYNRGRGAAASPAQTPTAAPAVGTMNVPSTPTPPPAVQAPAARTMNVPSTPTAAPAVQTPAVQTSAVPRTPTAGQPGAPTAGQRLTPPANNTLANNPAANRVAGVDPRLNIKPQNLTMSPQMQQLLAQQQQRYAQMNHR